jgi:hypothetical protein
MPKYSVSEVLEIIENLTEAEKVDLQAQLPTVLTLPSPSGRPTSAQQSQSFGNVTVGSGSDFAANQIASEDAVNITQGRTQVKADTSNIDSALTLLANIRQQLFDLQELNKLEKKHLASTIDVIEEELKTPSPDKSLIDQAVDVLEKGLRGVEKLAEPTLRVSKMLASMLVV